MTPDSCHKAWGVSGNFQSLYLAWNFHNSLHKIVRDKKLYLEPSLQAGSSLKFTNLSQEFTVHFWFKLPLIQHYFLFLFKKHLNVLIKKTNHRNVSILKYKPPFLKVKTLM